MRKILFLAGFASFLAITGVIANASEEAICATAPSDAWATPEAVNGMLSAMIDREYVLGVDKGCYEAEVVIDDDTMIDVYVDPVSLKIMRIRTSGESDS